MRQQGNTYSSQLWQGFDWSTCHSHTACGGACRAVLRMLWHIPHAPAAQVHRPATPWRGSCGERPGTCRKTASSAPRAVLTPLTGPFLIFWSARAVFDQSTSRFPARLRSSAWTPQRVRMHRRCKLGARVLAGCMHAFAAPSPRAWPQPTKPSSLLWYSPAEINSGFWGVAAAWASVQPQ